MLVMISVNRIEKVELNEVDDEPQVWTIKGDYETS